MSEVNRTDILQLNEYSLQREYFDRLEFVTQTLLSLASKTDANTDISIAGEQVKNASLDHLAINYIERLCQTVKALRFKYLFAGKEEYANVKVPTISIRDSGLPTIKEILSMKSDIAHLEELDMLPEAKELKHQLINSTLDFRRIPHGLRYDLSQRLYVDILKQNEIFQPIHHPELAYLVNHDKVQQGCLHWAVYDSQKHVPNIYILVFEYSGFPGFKDNEDLQIELYDYLQSQSLSTLKLLTIATDLDRRFKDFHPKMLKRLTVGPLYCSNLTIHNSHVQQVLDEMHSKCSDWLLGWTTETLLSKEVSQISNGFFGFKQKEVFSIDPYNREAFEAGVSQIDKSMIIPYSAFQALNDAENPLNDIRKYVVSRQNDITYL